MKETTLYIFCKDYLFGGGVVVGVMAHTHEEAKEVLNNYVIEDENKQKKYPLRKIGNSFAEYPLKGVFEVTGISFIRDYI